MIENWKYLKIGAFTKIDTGLPEDFGSFDFTSKHYNHWSCYPSSSSGSVVSCYEVKQDFYGKLPRFLIDLSFSEGDMLCFDASWEVVDYLSHIMPFIQYEQYKSDNE